MGHPLEAAHVCVLGGGRSGEREVSLTSAREIAAALSTPTDPEDRRGPRCVTTVEVGEDGRWRAGGDEPLPPGRALGGLADVDVFFSGLHGGEGEDGTLQALFALHGHAFTGSGVASAVAMDKVFARELVASSGLRVAAGARFSRMDWSDDRERVLERVRALATGSGWAVKPRGGGSSVGVSVLQDPSELPQALETALEWDEEVLVEAGVDGLEVAAGVLEERGRPRALPLVEIHPKDGGFFDYREKYAADGAREVCPAQELSAELVARVQADAVRAHQVLRASGYSRTDFLVPKAADGSWEAPVFLELNTLPGMTPRSLLPQAAAAAGLDFRSLCLAIAAEALG